MYFDEDIILDLRLNHLSAYIDKFIIVESKFTHSGEKRNTLFDINKFKKFKNKITYLVVDHEPMGIEEVYEHDDESEKSRKYILNAAKRENYQRNYITKGLEDAEPEEYLMNHSSATYLMGPNGAFLLHFSHGTDAEIMARRIREKLS